MEAHGEDPLLDEAGNLRGGGIIGRLVAIEGLDEFCLLHDLPDDALAIPLEDMAVRGPHRGHRGDKDAIERGLP